MKFNQLFTFVLGIILLGSCSKDAARQSLSPAEFNSKINASNNKLILDVRTPAEYELKHLNNSSNLDIYDEDLFTAGLQALDKEQPVFVYCKSGSRSSTAAAKLSDLGFKEIYELEGGIQAWTVNGLPVKEANKKAKAETYTLAEYNEFISQHELVLVDFMAEWCGPCKMMAPYVEKLEKEYEGKLTVLKIDTDVNRELSEHFQIFSIPTIKVYHQKELVHDKVGGQSEEMLRQMLGAYL